MYIEDCLTFMTNETIQYFAMNYSCIKPVYYCVGDVNGTAFQHSESSHLPSRNSSFSLPNLTSDTLPDKPKS